jgi:uncharacterized protein (UPF0548 family)
VFSLTQPSAAAIENQIAAAQFLPADTPQFLSISHGLIPAKLPSGYAHDRSRTRIGQGSGGFGAAKRAFAQWAPSDLGWARVANPKALVETGQIISVEVQSLGLWTLSLSRITQTIDSTTRFGFVYSTTRMHVEQGEERFLIEFDPSTGDVWYDLEAVSRPRHPLARLGYPVARAFQHRFARDSHRRMQEKVNA